MKMVKHGALDVIFFLDLSHVAPYAQFWSWRSPLNLLPSCPTLFYSSTCIVLQLQIFQQGQLREDDDMADIG